MKNSGIISGLEANFLLFALDAYCETDQAGNITTVKGIEGYTIEQINDLRWRLFGIHEHPEEYYEDSEISSAPDLPPHVAAPERGS